MPDIKALYIADRNLKLCEFGDYMLDKNNEIDTGFEQLLASGPN